MGSYRRFANVLAGSVLVGGLLGVTALGADAQAAVPEDGEPDRGEFFYDAANDRYYEVVTYGSSPGTWDDAREAAGARTIFGGTWQGYLATIKSESQNAFVVETIGQVDGSGVAPLGGYTNLWIAATDQDSEGDWRWATGPSAGQQFWGSGGPVAGRFSAWASPEPNDDQSGTGNSEDHAIANYRCMVTPYNQPCSATSSWNDVVGSGTVTDYVNGYLVAYDRPSRAPVAAPTVTCSPDPVVVGGTVTCVVAGGPPNVDILWQASVDGPFAGQGVMMDANGAGTFTFVAPAGTDGRTIAVELVAWGAEDSVAVRGVLTPSGIPAGPEAPAPLGLLAVPAVVVLAVGLWRRLLSTL